jgi:hypothetical protein
MSRQEWMAAKPFGQKLKQANDGAAFLMLETGAAKIAVQKLVFSLRIEFIRLLSSYLQEKPDRARVQFCCLGFVYWCLR